MRLDIQAVPPSLNKTLRLHWREKQELNAYWVLLVRGSFKPAKAAERKMRVKIILCHARMYDRDNLYGSVKPCVDALRHWRLIADDTDEWLDLTVEQEKCPHKKRHTRIELEVA